jgi:hypothetical protein
MLFLINIQCNVQTEITIRREYESWSSSITSNTSNSLKSKLVFRTSLPHTHHPPHHPQRTCLYLHISTHTHNNAENFHSSWARANRNIVDKQLWLKTVSLHHTWLYRNVCDGTPISKSLRSHINCLRLKSLHSKQSAIDVFMCTIVCPVLTLHTFWTQSTLDSVKNGVSFRRSRQPILSQVCKFGTSTATAISHALLPTHSPVLLTQLQVMVFSTLGDTYPSSLNKQKFSFQRTYTNYSQTLHRKYNVMQYPLLKYIVAYNYITVRTFNLIRTFMTNLQ